MSLNNDTFLICKLNYAYLPMRIIKEYISLLCMCVSVLACEKTVQRRVSKFPMKIPECVHLGFRFSNLELVFIWLIKNYNSYYTSKIFTKSILFSIYIEESKKLNKLAKIA